MMPADELSRLDIGFRNLLCATGLPDTQDLDISACLVTLGKWVVHVARETQRNLHRFTENPGIYRNSESYSPGNRKESL